MSAAESGHRQATLPAARRRGVVCSSVRRSVDRLRPCHHRRQPDEAEEKPPMTPPLPAPTPEVVARIAPTGTLRAAINLGNAVLAGRDAATGAPKGVTVDLAGKLA